MNRNESPLSYEPEKVFQTGLQYHHYANTAYPLTPASFRSFRVPSKDAQELLVQDWAGVSEMCLYMHIPFCQSRCRFCEYVVVENADQQTEDRYVDLLLQELELYRPLIASKKIIGFDLGGGTPARLSEENLKKIMSALKSLNFAENTVFSVETTPAIAAQNPEKIQSLFNLGFKRISMGVQTVSEKLLNELGREGTTRIYEKAIKNIRSAGFQSVNLDLMYGFLNQNDENFSTTLKYAVALEPEHITLYRNRYKGTRLEQEADGVSLYKAIRQYRLAYEILRKNGFEGNPGKNTFSRIPGDYGTSDYLTHRVIEGTPYLGLGLGAQSFGNNYLAYNLGAADKKMHRYEQTLERGEFPLQDLYTLPQSESMAKMLSVAFYFGFVDLQAFQNRFGASFEKLFSGELAFLFKEKLMEKKGERVYLTARGADYVNGIIPLFYSPRAKDELFKLYSRYQKPSQGEEDFLKAYRIADYPRPSLTVDIAAIANKRIVLIKRAEHPFMNQWALPGGFVRPGESAENAALREMQEESGITKIQLRQLAFFSEPHRDPRGWIVSCAFLGVIDGENLDRKDLKNSDSLQFGDDAIDAAWFSIDCRQEGEKILLILKNQNTLLEAEMVSENEGTQVLRSDGLAFDHCKIIWQAWQKYGSSSLS
jgi:oxygen-independent coproporphyrinogen-3 oxidase